MLVLAAGCGGGGNGSGSVANTTLPATLPVGSDAPTSYAQSGTSLTITGSVYSVQSSTEFSVNSGAGCGDLHVFTTSATTFSPTGAKVAAGDQVTAKGTGTCSTSLAATSVTLSSSTSTGTPRPTPTPVPAGSGGTTSAFMPSSNGKISAFQIFDETGNGTISLSSLEADGYRYSAVWGARPGVGASWRVSNANLRAGYYMLMDTDMSSSGWGAIGHTISWWQTNHPTWIMYACTSSGTPTHTPAYDSGLPNVPLDLRNPSVVQYQISQAAKYAYETGYNALAIDEVTFWFPGSGGPGYYPCGHWNGSTFVREYSSATDSAWVTDVVNWVTAAYNMLHSSSSAQYAYHLKMFVSHPAENVDSSEAALLAHTDADMDESGFTDYGNLTHVPKLREVNWMNYAQAHGTAVLINNDWGSITMGPMQIDASIALYLLGNDGAASLFASSHTGYGLENYYSAYNTNIGASCGAFYQGSAPGIYYRKFANALVVANLGTSGTETAALPTTHSYSDIEGRGLTSSHSVSVAEGDGYVLRTTNGCSP